MSVDSLNSNHLLAIAAQFEDSFSIDWLLELSGAKASTGLREMDTAIQIGILEQTESGIYCFIDHEQRKALLKIMPVQQCEDLQRRILALYLREKPGESQFTRSITAHLLRADSDIEICQWLYQAGFFYKKALERDMAQRCFFRIVNAFQGVQGEEADRLFVKAAIEYSKSVYSNDHGASAYKILKDAMSRAKKLHDEVSAATIEIHLSSVQWFRGKHVQSYKHYEKACDLAGKIRDPQWQRSFSIFKIIESTVWGRYRDALIDYEKFTPDVAKYPRYWHSFRGAIYLGISLAYTGNIAQGLGLVHSIRNHCRKMGNSVIACEAGVQLVNVLIDIRNIDKAIYYIKETRQEADSLQNNLLKKFLLNQLAYCYYLKNEHQASASTLKESLGIKDGDLPHQPSYPFALELAWAMEQKKYPQIDLFQLNELIESHIEVLNVDIKGIAFRYKALVDEKRGKSKKSVLESLRQSQKWLDVSGHKTELARTLLEIQRYYLSHGNEKKAAEMEVQAREVLAGIDPDLIPLDLNVLNSTCRNEKILLEEILKLSREIASIRNTKELVQQIISTAIRITGAERGAIFLLEEQNRRGKLQLRASKTLTDQDVADAEFEGPMALVNQTAVTGKGCVKVYGKDKNGNTISQGRIHSCVCVPMIIRDKVVGVMYHDNSLLASSLLEADLVILSHFAAQAAIAIDNASAYAQVKRLNRHLREEKEYYKEKVLENIYFEEIVGKSQTIMQVLTNIKRVAETDATVLILGETGVGKELVARAVHAQSERCKGPFIRVHCSALPESLISSELFGHEKGAFTGAGQKRVGRFELADKGTLFLDEIGELPMEIQVHLLRVLQTGEFERVGGSETISSNFRLVLATNQDLEKAVREKRFRRDLYYRINVFPITVPPLRERKEDIPLLASHFLNLYGSRLNKLIHKIRQKNMKRLIGYDWPGNVRELENVIERAMILSSGPELTLPELRSDDFCSIQGGTDDLPTLKENERRLITAALIRTHGKVQGQGGAADLLEINPQTLKSRMKKLGITRDQVMNL
jgi:transcriptional regulator with GAF, ATPase, and Fis domain